MYYIYYNIIQSGKDLNLDIPYNFEYLLYHPLLANITQISSGVILLALSSTEGNGWIIVNIASVFSLIVIRYTNLQIMKKHNY